MKLVFLKKIHNLICESGLILLKMSKSQEVILFPKKPKNKGFFEKFFNFFN